MCALRFGYVDTNYTRGSFKVQTGVTATSLRMDNVVDQYANGKLKKLTLNQLVQASHITGGHGIQSKCE